MPKVERNAKKQPLQEVGISGMDSEEAGPLPDKPKFEALQGAGERGGAANSKVEFRRVPVPQHRMTPLKTAWLELYKPVTENLKVDMRMNLKTKKVRAHGAPAYRRRARLAGRRRCWAECCHTGTQCVKLCCALCV
jgi:hypothetical protein